MEKEVVLYPTWYPNVTLFRGLTLACLVPGIIIAISPEVLNEKGGWGSTSAISQIVLLAFSIWFGILSNHATIYYFLFKENTIYRIAYADQNVTIYIKQKGSPKILTLYKPVFTFKYLDTVCEIGYDAYNFECHRSKGEDLESHLKDD